MARVWWDLGCTSLSGPGAGLWGSRAQAGFRPLEQVLVNPTVVLPKGHIRGRCWEAGLGAIEEAY